MLAIFLPWPGSLASFDGPPWGEASSVPGWPGVAPILSVRLRFSADGTERAARKLERVLTTDPGMGVVRHVDAGYERAIDVARERGIRIPMRP